MNHRIMIFLLAIAITGCSGQPESVQRTGESHVRDTTHIRIWDLVILPENPRSVDPLQVSMKLGGAEPERLEYQWLRNGEPIPGAIRPTLDSEYVSKGDFIAVTVRANQGGGKKYGQTSESVAIGNSKPVATFAGVEPGTPRSSEKLKALDAGYDPDREDVDFVYQWIVNGESLVGQEEQFLASNHFRRGDLVQVEVTPYDGEEFGMTLRSAAVVVGNSPPRIVSDPPKHTEDGTFRYAVRVEDADGDRLKFSLQGGPPQGLEIDSTTGLIQWKPVTSESGVAYVFQVVAEDPEGATSVQEITLNYKPGA